MALDITARGLALSVDAKLGEVPKGKTIMELLGAIEVGGYDDTEIKERLAALEAGAEEMDKDLAALQALVGEEVFEENVVEIITQTVSPLAISGNVNDLTQDEGDYVTLTCGTSDE